MAEARNPIKGKITEVLGHYNPTSPNKDIHFDQERVHFWISRGAQPTDSIASLLKRAGMQNMERYIGPRNFQHKNKKEMKAAGADAQSNAPEASKKPVASAVSKDAASKDTV